MGLRYGPPRTLHRCFGSTRHACHYSWCALLLTRDVGAAPIELEHVLLKAHLSGQYEPLAIRQPVENPFGILIMFGRRREEESVKAELKTLSFFRACLRDRRWLGQRFIDVGLGLRRAPLHVQEPPWEQGRRARTPAQAQVAHPTRPQRFCLG